MQIYFHSCLCSYLPRVPILVEDTVFRCIYYSICSIIGLIRCIMILKAIYDCYCTDTATHIVYFKIEPDIDNILPKYLHNWPNIIII